MYRTLDDSQDAPADQNNYISGPGGANGKIYQDAIASTALQYQGVSYDESSQNYVINFQFGSKVITSTGGVNRVLEFSFQTSPNLNNNVQQVTVSNSDGSRTLVNNNGTYYIKYTVGKVVGGNVNVSVYVNPVKVTDGDWVSAFMSTHRERSNGTLIPTSTEIAFSATRSLTYQQFGNDFNTQLLSSLKSNALKDLNQTSPLNSTTNLKSNYTNSINSVTIDGDFASQIQSIRSAFHADSTSLSSSISALNNQSSLSVSNVSGLVNLTDDDKKSALNAIKMQQQTTLSNLMSVTQASQISGTQNNGIEAIKKIELQATIQSAINAISDAAKETTGKIQSDNTLTEDQYNNQINKVLSDKKKYTDLLSQITNSSSVASLRDQGIMAINGDYTAGESLVTQKKTAQAAIDAETQKTSAAI
ncbi:DUF1542 domain-containing protein, partial [Fructobacillus tropaeoli]